MLLFSDFEILEFNTDGDQNFLHFVFCFVLQNNGLGGLMRKYLVCMVAGVAVSLIGIRSDYHNKLAIFYTSQRYENLNRMIQARWREKKNGESDLFKRFVKVMES